MLTQPLITECSEEGWITLTRTTAPGFLRIIGALALAIVFAIGSSVAIAGFLTDWGRDRNPDSGPVTQPCQIAAATAAPNSSSSTSE